MSLGQYLEYIARFVLIMPCVMRKRSKGSIGLTNSSPWRHAEQECRLPSGVAILSDTSADAWPRTSREKFTNMKTHTHTRPTRGLYSVLCLSLVLNHCKIKGVNFQKNIEWPCQKIEKSRCQENLHVHINTVSLSLCFIFNV